MAGVSEQLQVRFEVPFAYNVSFTRGVFDPHNPALLDALRQREPERRHRMLVVVDSGVAQAWPGLGRQVRAYAEHHGKHLDLAAEPLVVEGGEAAKTAPGAATAVYRAIADARIDRQSFCVVVGGGAVQDMAGFAAATAHRGVRTVRVPTTVLSQNDSGVGVKNGVNWSGFKNFAGTFAVPFAVINDYDFLETLERRDRIAGLAEAVKVSLIRDRSFFFWLEEQADALAALESAATEFMVRRCAQLHTEHIATSGDPFEQGSARPLDFGHWAAHKLESLTGHRLRHGEAVAIGMALDVRYSVKADLLAKEDGVRVEALLRRLGFRLWDEALELRSRRGGLAVVDGLAEFREHLGGELTVCLLEAPGWPIDIHTMDPALIEQCVTELKAEHGLRRDREAER